MHIKIKPGDIVEVLRPSEISRILDYEGSQDNLPFMPEMISSCGKRFRVISKIEKTCVNCTNIENSVKDKIKEFTFNDIVFLEGQRCSGTSHEGCQRGCMIFWKEAWLKKPNDVCGGSPINPKEVIELNNKLKTKESNDKFICQSTQLNRATRNISMSKRLLKLIIETFNGRIKFSTAFKSISYPILRKLKYDRQIKGNLKTTPTITLALQPGDLIQIKTFQEILKTLDTHGRNRGLRFYTDMKKYCGNRFRVRNRLEKMINEASGKMVEVQNTVILDDLTCSYEYGFMGCPRANYQFWREIWLTRIE